MHSHDPAMVAPHRLLTQVPTTLPRNTRGKAWASKREQQVKYTNDREQISKKLSVFFLCFKDSFIEKEAMFQMQSRFSQQRHLLSKHTGRGSPVGL